MAMSSGFFGFFAHCGMLRALEERGLLPAAVAGASAGALVAGAWAAGLSAEILASHLLGLSRRDFWDPRPGLGLLSGQRFAQLLDQLLPAQRFDQCRTPLAVSVFELRTRQTVVLKRGALTPAIRASCAVPLLFHPVRINGRLYADGGIADRPAMVGVRRDERVLYHHIASRSPWRVHAPQIPSRPKLTALVIDGLPRSGPFRLQAGHQALQLAHEATKRALGLPRTQTGQLSVSC